MTKGINCSNCQNFEPCRTYRPYKTVGELIDWLAQYNRGEIVQLTHANCGSGIMILSGNIASVFSIPTMWT